MVEITLTCDLCGDSDKKESNYHSYELDEFGKRKPTEDFATGLWTDIRLNEWTCYFDGVKTMILCPKCKEKIAHADD